MKAWIDTHWLPAKLAAATVGSCAGGAIVIAFNWPDWTSIVTCSLLAFAALRVVDLFRDAS